MNAIEFYNFIQERILNDTRCQTGPEWALEKHRVFMAEWLIRNPLPATLEIDLSETMRNELFAAGLRAVLKGESSWRIDRKEQ